MSNTCTSTLVLTGPATERDRFVADVASVPDYDFLQAHVPAERGGGSDAWGTRGIKTRGLVLNAHNDTCTEYALATHWSPPSVWFEQVCALFPTLRFELFLGCQEGAFAGYLLAEDGHMVNAGPISSGFEGFFAARGRPGYFTGWWEGLDELHETEDDFPTVEEAETGPDDPREWSQALPDSYVLDFASSEPQETERSLEDIRAELEAEREARITRPVPA